MSSQIGASRSLSIGLRRDGAEPSPRERVARLLRDPKGYFDDAKRWAGRKARADVARELDKKEAGRTHRIALLRIFGFARS